MQTPEFPCISVIIPVRNGEKSIVPTLESLKTIDYPKDQLEIIIVDNKSSDNTLSVLKTYPFTILKEDRRLSSYAARNKGVFKSRGDILVFTDGDCIVTPGWLFNYATYLKENPSDIVAGHVEMVTKPEPNIYETYDRCKFDQEFFVREFQFGATANLLVKRTVFEKIGVFDSSLISSGDLQFCQKAVKSGFRIDFCRSAVVNHPARSTLRALLKKEARIGFGYSQIFFKHKLGHLFVHRWELFFPNRDFLRFKSRELNFGKTEKTKFVVVDWMCNCAWVYGNVYGILKLQKKQDFSES